MKLVTYATHSTGYFEALKESASRNHFDFEVIGFGTKWIGFTQRLHDIKQRLASYKPDEIIALVDGFDVIVLGTPEELERKFLALDTDKVLFSASKDNFIMNTLFGPIHPKDANDETNRLQAGCYIGYAKSIIKLITHMCEYAQCANESNDQELLTVHYKDCTDCIVLDKPSALFYNMDFDVNPLYGYFAITADKQDDLRVPLQSKYYTFDNDRIKLTNGETPVILHASCNLNIDEFCEALKLPKKVGVDRNYFEYSTNLYMQKISEQYPVLKAAVLYLIKGIHIGIMIFMFVGVFAFTSIVPLMMVIAVSSLVLLQWYIVGNCVFTPIENMLSGSTSKYEDGTDRSFFTDIPSKLFGRDNVRRFFTVAPFVIILIALYRIYHIKTDCKIALRKRK